MSGTGVTSTQVVASTAVAGAAIVALWRPRAARSRLRVISPRPVRPRTARTGPPGWTVRGAAVLAGGALALVVGGQTGALLGVVAAIVLDRVVRRLEPASVRRERAQARAELPFAVDLLAAVIRTGAPTGSAVTQVGEAIGGPLGGRLGQVGSLLSLGAPSNEAWAELAALPEAAPLTRAAVRAADSGAALAGACERLASELRAARDAALQTRSRRAEVLTILPLGLCFLPAFVLVGVVPVVMGVLDAALA